MRQTDTGKETGIVKYSEDVLNAWDAMAEASVANRKAAFERQGGEVEAESGGTVQKQARVDTDAQSGRPIYQSNFPKGTPKAAKAQHILTLIQNVWSKKTYPTNSKKCRRKQQNNYGTI